MRPTSRARELTRLRVSSAERCRQWYHGRRDAGRGVPTVAAGSAAASPATPHLSRLAHERDEVVESARRSAIDDTAAQRAQTAQLRRHATQLEQHITDRRAALAAAAGTDAELAHVGAGEEHLPADIARSRRAAEAARRGAAITTQITPMQTELDDVYEQIALLEAEVVARVRRAQALAEGFCAYTDARASRYWRTLTRHHPQGKQLAEAHRPTGRDLTWITSADHWTVLNAKETA